MDEEKTIAVQVEADTTETTDSRKKPYEKPQIVYQGALEAMAAVCLPAPPGKAVPGIGGCTTGYS